MGSTAVSLPYGLYQGGRKGINCSSWLELFHSGQTPHSHYLHYSFHMKTQDIPGALESSCFNMSNSLFPTYSLLQKVWLKVRSLQGVIGFTEYSPIWHNSVHTELVKLPCAGMWKHWGNITNSTVCQMQCNDGRPASSLVALSQTTLQGSSD